MAILNDIPDVVGFVLIALIWIALISIPGLGITYLGWKLSRGIRPLRRQIIVRASLIALALTPSIYGHGMILPAVLVAFSLDGKDKLIAVVPIIFVWLVATVTLSVRARRQIMER
jgi:hypothetical protein